MKIQKYSNDQRKHSTSRLLGLCALTLLIALTWMGCKSGTTNTADAELAGAYTLVKVDGKNLPCAVAHPGSPTVKSGVFTFNADGTCSSKITFVTPSGGEAERYVKARYTREAGKLKMKWEGAGTTIGEIEDGTFTMNNEGNVFVYRK